jgi:cytochrome c biogenesis protein CcdA/thiol-disulfide isomerase/thioredoxin
VLVLLIAGFLAGVITALSPCVLPVLPIVLAGGATGRRPLAIVAGIVASFTVFTLFAAWLLDLLGLPDDLLRNLAIALLFLVAATLLWPRAGALVERPLRALTRRPAGDLGGGFLLGASLGLVFVPCAGPILAAITTIAASRDVGARGLALTFAFAVGAALPLLAIAIAGQGAATRLRTNALAIRRAGGVLIAAAAVAMTLGLDQDLQVKVPNYVESVQGWVEGFADDELTGLTGGRAPEAVAGHGSDLPDYGVAPELAGIEAWINARPTTLEQLRGSVVLIDFWTYSCINCLRTLPYLKAWDARYRSAGLTIVGVHTPEFAFERVERNVRENTRRLGLRYAVALDNGYATWNAWHNQYWPAKYLVDRSGHVRYFHFGEGEYDVTEARIRTLLGESGPTVALEDESPHGLVTPETYLGYERLDRYAGDAVTEDEEAAYALPAKLLQNEVGYGGRWRVEGERIVAGAGARLRLAYRARDVHLVLGGRGSVQVLVDGRPETTVRVTGDRLYTLAERPALADHLLELRFAPGVAGYAFTFG